MDTNNESPVLTEQDIQEQIKYRLAKLADLTAAGKDPFEEIVFDVSSHSTDITDHFDVMEGQEVRVAGRLLSRRGMGKVSFCDLYDKKGQLISVFEGNTKTDLILASFK